MEAWKVHSGGKGRDVSDAFWDKGVAGIGWGLGDLSGASTREEIKNKLRVKDPDRSEGSLGNVAGTLHRFVNEIEVGDLIVTPPTENQDVMIGQCQSHYKYLPGLLPEGHEDVREVHWLKRIPRSALSDGLQSSCSGEITVSNLNKHIAEIKTLLGEVTRIPSEARWDEFIDWAKRFYEWDQFDEAERDYKLRVGERLAAAKQSLLNGTSNWQDLLRMVFRAPDSNLRDWRINDAFLKLDSPLMEEALLKIWGQDISDSLADRIQGFQELSQVGTPGVLASILLMADDATQNPMYRYTPLRDAHQLTDYPSAANDSSDAWERYEHALGFFDKFIQEASSRGLRLRDRLDAQALTWCVTRYGKEDLPEDWPEEVKEKFIAYQRGETATPLPPPPRDLHALAEDVYLPVEFLEDIVTLLEDKKQVIFQGPPGTGKTYVAKELAKNLAGSEERVTLVQFHPSYAYEDFVQGFRPDLVNGQPGFEIKDGPLLRAAEQARKEPGAKHYLVIDEINRGNIAKVFGELYFLLEYRNEKMRLQYQGEDEDDFTLPGNLYVIGTMNTADRSIALVDLALRRRFYFVEFHPDDEPVKSVLKKWLDANGLAEMDWVADVVERTNEKLQDDRHAAIGPSYFMDGKLDDAAVERIWKHSVLPYIEERRFSGEQAAEEFRLDKLRREVSPAGAGEDGDGGGESETAA